ncbi:MAG: hypothetical protein RMY30_007780, partial [Nostoc sp. CmiSLP01]|nr:hypothetical protein [Nostoc sp. CmiSLP01]
MKTRLHCATIFNLRLMGAMPVALSLVLYPAIVQAKLTNENLFLQAHKGVEDRAVENKVVEKSMDVNSGVGDSGSQKVAQRLSEKPVEASAISHRLRWLAANRTFQGKGAKVRRIIRQGLNSSDLLGSSRKEFRVVEFPSTSLASATITPTSDIQPNETEIKAFQPATSVELPKGLRKIAGIENKKDQSSREIQPFQPAISVDLPRGLRKIANGDVKIEGQGDKGTGGQGDKGTGGQGDKGTGGQGDKGTGGQ